jgi:hypothetical protein
VCRDDVVAEFQLDIGSSGPLLRPIMELELFDIGDETGIPHPLFRNCDAFAAEVIVFAVEAIGKLLAVIKYEVPVVV